MLNTGIIGPPTTTSSTLFGLAVNYVNKATFRDFLTYTADHFQLTTPITTTGILLDTSMI